MDISAEGDSSEGTEARVAAVHSAYEGLWADFLRNRWQQTEERAEVLLRIIHSLPQLRRVGDAELLVTEADFLYMLGTVRGNHVDTLLRALDCYERSVALPAGRGNLNARRMRAETLLRLRRYKEAFEAFGALSADRVSPWEDLEVAPFRLLHDAALCERLCRLGRLNPEKAEEAAASLRQVAKHVAEQGFSKGSKKWPCIAQLEKEQVALLKRGLFDELHGESDAYPVARWVGQAQELERSPLRETVDWAHVEASYAAESFVVIDGIFTDEALAELWAYAREAPCFRTVRRGFLGAFPADGNVHPLLLQIAVALESHMPKTFAGHPLGLWWMFKYTESAPQGIGIHADAAAVNVNIWLTPDAVRKDGGGLDIYMQLPPDEAGVSEFNHEFATEAAEAEFRRKLIAAGGVKHIEYKQNRAVIFVSDLYHESEPFTFLDAIEQPRINLTYLFGDRTMARSSRLSPSSPDKGDSGVKDIQGKRKHEAESLTEDGWDLFG